MLASQTPMTIVHNMPPLHSNDIAGVAIQLSRQLPETLFDLVIRHTHDPTVLEM